MIGTARLNSCLLLPVFLMASGIVSCCAIAEDRAAVELVGGLFASHVLADNPFALNAVAKDLSAEARYGTFKSHLLPGKSLPESRLLGKLTPTEAPESAVFQRTVDIARIQPGCERNQWRIHTGGVTVLQVFDLIEVATETARLHELQFAVHVTKASGEIQQRWQLSSTVVGRPTDNNSYSQQNHSLERKVHCSGPQESGRWCLSLSSDH